MELDRTSVWIWPSTSNMSHTFFPIILTPPTFRYLSSCGYKWGKWPTLTHIPTSPPKQSGLSLCWNSVGRKGSLQLKRARFAILLLCPSCTEKLWFQSSTEEQPRSDEFIFFSHQRYRGRDHDLRPYDQHQQGAMGPKKNHQDTSNYIFHGKKLSFSTPEVFFEVFFQRCIL